MKSILIIRFSSIGDIVLCSPVVRQLKNNGYEITMITKFGFKDLWKNNPYIDHLVLLKELSDLDIEKLRDKNFDYIIDLHNNKWANKIKNGLNVESFTLSKSNVNKALLVWTKCKRFKSTHIVERYLETIFPIIKEKDTYGLDFFEDEISEDLIHLTLKPFAVFIIGGQHKGKMMSPSRMIEYCNEIDFPMILIGGPEDKITGQSVEIASGDNIKNYAGKLSLMDSVNLIKYSKFVVSHDTGLMHIASAYKKDIISLWGATTPELGFSPYKPGSRSILLEQFHILRPSSKLGKQRVFKSINFIDRIPLDRLVKESNKLWS